MNNHYPRSWQLHMYCPLVHSLEVLRGRSVILSHSARLVNTTMFIWGVQNCSVCVCRGTSYHRAGAMLHFFFFLSWAASSRKLCP